MQPLHDVLMTSWVAVCYSPTPILGAVDAA